MCHVPGRALSSGCSVSVAERLDSSAMGIAQLVTHEVGESNLGHVG